MFVITYLHIAITFFLVFFILDVFYTKVFYRYKKLAITFISVCAVFFFVRVLLGIKMGVWQYGVGTSMHRFLSIPLEEYLYMFFAPYGLVVSWESLNKFLRKKSI